MLIMIIFLILTVIFIIGTSIYLSYKKKNINHSINQSSQPDFEKKLSKKDKKKLANILDLKIKNNIICLGNRYSIVIKLGNIDYNMLSSKEQDSIENVLIQTALSIDYPVQFFSTTEYIDTSKVVSFIKQNQVKNAKLQEYKEYLIKYLESLMENRSISVIKNYAIISCNGLYENAVQELDRKSLSFKSNLLRAKVVCEILNEDELYNLIYRELNKNAALNISNLKKGEKNLYVGKKQKTQTKRN